MSATSSDAGTEDQKRFEENANHLFCGTEQVVAPAMNSRISECWPLSITQGM